VRTSALHRRNLGLVRLLELRVLGRARLGVLDLVLRQAADELAGAWGAEGGDEQVAVCAAAGGWLGGRWDCSGKNSSSGTAD
jgi:hypothetical protein